MFREIVFKCWYFYATDDHHSRVKWERSSTICADNNDLVDWVGLGYCQMSKLRADQWSALPNWFNIYFNFRFHSLILMFSGRGQGGFLRCDWTGQLRRVRRIVITYKHWSILSGWSNQTTEWINLPKLFKLNVLHFDCFHCYGTKLVSQL